MPSPIVHVYNSFAWKMPAGYEWGICLNKFLTKSGSKLKTDTYTKKMHYFFGMKALIGDTIRLLCVLLETGPPFYVVIWATWRSSHFQGKGGTFISQSVLDPECLSSARIQTHDLPLGSQALYQLS